MGSRAATTCSPSTWRWTRSPVRDGELGARVRRLPPAARPLDAAAHPVAGRHGARPLRRRLGGRLAGRRVAAADPRGARSSGPRGWVRADVASELEFYLLNESYAEAHGKDYRGLTPSVPYILDYNVLATTYDESLIREIRNGMHGAGIAVESSKGEAWPGQHEINFRYADALTMADTTSSTRTARRRSHTHTADRSPSWRSPTMRGSATPATSTRACGATGRTRSRASSPVLGLPRRVDGVRARARAVPRAERQLVQALRPRVVGADDARVGARQPHVRLSHRRPRGRRAVETRIPGGDVNPYLAFAALIAAGLHGIEQGLEPRRACDGNAYESDAGVSVDAARGDRRARGGDDGARGFRRRGRRSLPELRAHRAAALRRGRDLLGAGAAVRAWLGPRRRDHDVPSLRRVRRVARSSPRSSRTTTCARWSAPAGGRCSFRRRERRGGDARRARRR